MLRLSIRPLALIFVFLLPSVLTVSAQQTDQNFGTNGLVLTNFPPVTGDPFERATEHAVKSFSLSGGNILTLAQVDNRTAKGPPSIGVRLLMYLNNGSLFATVGGEGNFVLNDAVQQPDGKIIAVGYTYGIYNASQLGALNWKIVRFNQNGAQDTTFNATGVVTRGFADNDDVINSVALQTDGKIVVSGTSANSANGTVTIVGRFNANGSVDTSFGPYGDGFFDIYDGGSKSRKALITANGKILLGGSMPDETGNRNLVVAQYNPNGSPDAGFGNQGAKILDFGGAEFFSDMALQSDQRIVLLAVSEYGVPGSTNYVEQEINVVRLNFDGSFDPMFGAFGRMVINTSPAKYNGSADNYAPNGSETPGKILVQQNGNILFSAVSLQLLPTRRYVITIYRLNSTGRITARNFSRRTPTNQGVGDTRFIQIRDMIVEQNGKILISGGVNFQFIADSQIALARYTALSAVNDTNPFFDYNFDGKAEFAVYRPNASGLGLWLFLRSPAGGVGSTYSFDSREYGAAGDLLAPGDYDGDGVQDLAVFRPATGEWITGKVYLDNCAPMGCAETIQFGASGDIPAPGDFDGDGRTDRAVFRPSDGNWYILFSTGGYNAFHFGQNGDKPVTGDFDGDGKSDAAVIRRENGKIFWYISQSSNGQFLAFQFGNSEDKTAIADYNGDAKTEVAVWRPSNGTWYILANYTDFSFVQFGSNGDIPIPSDFDGDKKDDIAVYTPATGAHTFIRSSDGIVGGTEFGLPTDIPIASAYVR
jgi:uncharacterized delta-60 repeat protein